MQRSERRGYAIRAGVAVAGILVGGIASIVTVSAQQVVSTTALCAPGSGGLSGAAPCFEMPNVVGATRLLDQATVQAESDRYVRFMLWAPGTCGVAGANPIAPPAVEPVGGAAAIHTATITMTTAYSAKVTGTYQWTTEILHHDMSVDWGPSGCGESVDVIKASPSLFTNPSGAGAVGGSLVDQAAVVSGDAPSGIVTFALFPPSDPTCSGTPVVPPLEEPVSDGLASTAVSPVVSDQLGTYHWTAVYSGDANNRAASSSCAEEAVRVVAASPRISTKHSAGGAVGISLHDTATVKGGDHPSGKVTFSLFGPGDRTCSGTPLFTDTERPLSSGPFSVTSTDFVTSAPGTYTWVATFHSGNAVNHNASTRCGADTVTITAPASGVQAISTSTPGTPGTGAGLGGVLLPAGLLLMCGAGLASFAILVRYQRREG